MFRYFEENLRTSKILIVIGYGFGDRRINDFIQDSFFVGNSKDMFVVDIKCPDHDLLRRDNSHFIEGGVYIISESGNFQRLK